MRFRFQPVGSIEQVREGFAALASVLLARPVRLEPVQRRALPDPNGGGATYEADYAAAGVALRESIAGAGGGGDPRDGYGYDLTFELQVSAPAGPVRAKMYAGGMTPTPTAFDVAIEGAPVHAFEALRSALRGLFGKDADHTADPWLVRETVLAMERAGGMDADPPDVAVALVHEALAGSAAGAFGRAELVDWLARRSPAHEDRRTREAPAVLAGWLAALDTPHPPLRDTDVRAALARLCPFDPERLRAAGIVAGPWVGHPSWPFAGTRSEAAGSSTPWHRVHIEAAAMSTWFTEEASRALTGWRTHEDWQEIAGESVPGALPGWRCLVVRAARYARASDVLPRVRVTMTAVRRPVEDWSLPPSTLAARPLDERVAWTWIPGTDTGEWCLIVRRDLRGANGPGPAGVAWCAVGSPAFRREARAALAAATPFRWHACDANEALTPWVVTESAWLAAAKAGPLPALVDAALAEVGASESDRAFAAANLCACPDRIGYCEHRRALLARQRTWDGAVRALSEPAACQAARAAAAAWGAAFSAAGARPNSRDVHRAASRVDAELRLFGAMRGDADRLEG